MPISSLTRCVGLPLASPRSGDREDVAVRLRLSNKARKRLACASDSAIERDPKTLAYRVGVQCAADRLLLGRKPSRRRRNCILASAQAAGHRGALIKRGLPEGPIVAKTLRAIEDRWVEAGFPDGEALEKIVSQALSSAV